MNLTIRPLTPELWPKLEDLFGESGAVGGCWCMYWRLGRAICRRSREENKAAFRAVMLEWVRAGPTCARTHARSPDLPGWAMQIA